MTSPLDSLPTVGGNFGTWGNVLNAYLQNAIPWVTPEQFGTTGQNADGAIINRAIQALQSTGQAGVIVLQQPYDLEQSVVVAGAPPVHFVFQNGAMNRNQIAVPTFLGGRLRPALGANPLNLIQGLLSIGTPGAPQTNPNATLLYNPTMSGRDKSGNNFAGLTGLSIQDCCDTAIIRPQFANFDPAGTGVGIFVQGSASVAAAGTDIIGGVHQNSANGLVIDGIGATDYRLIGGLFRTCPQAMSLGPTGGGGGGQVSDNHYVHGAAVGGNFAIAVGGGGADVNIHHNYFDTYGTAIPVQITPRNVAMLGNHFLASGNCAGPLVTYAAATARLTFCENWADANGSGMTALLKYTGLAGAPPAGVVVGNFVYNHTGALIGTIIDNANVAVPATNTASTYVQGNVRE
jgi:hypothetical protein